MIRKEVKEAKGKPTFYTVTDSGKKLLDRLETSSVGRVVRLHNFCVSYPVVREPRVPIDWGKVVRLNNWNQLVGSALGLTCRKNPRSLEIYADVVEGDNPYELLYRAQMECDYAASHLESKFQMKLGRGSPSRKPHWSVYDPVAEKFSEQMEFSDPELAKIDRSPPSPGEIDFFNPDAAKSYLLTMTSMPTRIRQFEKQIEIMAQGLATIDQRMAKVESAIILLPEQIRSGIVEGLKAALRKPEPCWSLEKFIRIKGRIA